MTSVNVLPDDVLLAVFDFCVDEDSEAWHSLVHVCQRWRCVVFGSPRRLNLQLFCTPGTPRETLDVWPPLPIAIWAHDCITEELDNMIALFDPSDRVCQINLMDIPSSQYLERLLEGMQKPLPGLTNLTLLSNLYVTTPVVPDSFLSGYAPCLRELSLDRIPFPGLPKLLSSATDLVSLYLLGVPHSGYISPEAMVTALSTSTNLRSFYLIFKSSRSHLDRESRHRPSPKRTILPVLTELKFKGVSEYLEVLLFGIDAPRLSALHISFFDQIKFGAPKLVQFICRTPRLKELERAHVSFEFGITRVNLTSQTSGYRTLSVGILCRELNLHLSSLQEVLTPSLPPLSTLEDLYIHEGPLTQLDWQGDIENIPWLELLYPFAAVKNLYLSEQSASRIAPCLQLLVQVGSRTTKVLPSLENMFLEGHEPSRPVQEGIRQFVAARLVNSRPIAVSRWERHEDEDFDEECYDFDGDDEEEEDED
jgi:hypothetical protein